MDKWLGIAVLLGLLAFFGWRALGQTLSLPDTVRDGMRRFYASEQLYLRVVAWFSTISFPVWLLLFLGVLWSIWTLFFGERPPADDPVALRLHYLGIGSMVLAMLALVGAPLGLIRIWTSERQTRTAESNLTTDLINKAVEGLGAEKTVSRIGRPVAGMNADRPEVTEIQWEGTDLPAGAKPSDDWKTFDKTEPNLEVRIGAILTLERIARENPDEHIRVMELLCAYIRENAPARSAQPNPLDPLPDYPENPTPDDLKARHEVRDDRKQRLEEWKEDLRASHAPRTDIQTALEVIGRRTEDQITREGKPDAEGNWTGYRLDLRRTNLQAADLADLPDRPMNFQNARFQKARLEGADLWRTRMDGADLWQARLDAADLKGALIKGADLSWAKMERTELLFAEMQGANLSWAQMEGAMLYAARMQGAVLRSARLVGANLMEAHIEGAKLSGAYLQGAVLTEVRMQGAILSEARMHRADVRWARMDGADLGMADLRSATWEGAETGARTHGADFRGARNLSQAQLDCMIGDASTLLPETLDDGSVPSIPSCWPTPPPFFEAMITRLSFGDEVEANRLRAEFLCSEGTDPVRTGTPLPLDAPYPEGHPLADQTD